MTWLVNGEFPPGTFISDERMPSDKLTFRNPETGEVVATIINIGVDEEPELDDDGDPVHQCVANSADPCDRCNQLNEELLEAMYSGNPEAD